MRLAGGILDGAIAGAAGATGLNAATYLDMAARGRSSSSAPEDTVEKLADKASVRIPGDQESHADRVAGSVRSMGSPPASSSARRSALYAQQAGVRECLAPA
jgi:hypothetical protein